MTANEKDFALSLDMTRVRRSPLIIFHTTTKSYASAKYSILRLYKTIPPLVSLSRA